MNILLVLSVVGLQKMGNFDSDLASLALIDPETLGRIKHHDETMTTRSKRRTGGASLSVSHFQVDIMSEILWTARQRKVPLLLVNHHHYFFFSVFCSVCSLCVRIAAVCVYI
jgi:hypothetical protein